jgi:hypothetical protein
MDIWSILRSFEIFYDLLVYFVLIWYIFPRFGMLCLEKSGNPGSHTHQVCPSLLREHWSRFDSRKCVHIFDCDENRNLFRGFDQEILNAQSTANLS